MFSKLFFPLTFSVLSSLVLGGDCTVSAQSIIPANDGTGTIINENGDRITIDGGSFSADGTNLFHSFEQFGLNRTQIAEFLSDPQVNNIFSRIVSGNPSIINGLIQITGGDSNLYLMNPAGIVFGQGASLNISGDFFATTATGIGFNNQNWFNILGDNNYTELLGNPSQFAFDLAEAGTIINAGNLTLNPEQNLTLLAGSVFNTGTMATASGNIIISAVPGSSIVRISKPGSLLSLEIDIARDTEGNITAITPLNLPELLTGTDTEITTTGNNTVAIENSGTVVPFSSETAIWCSGDGNNCYCFYWGCVNLYSP